MNRFCVIASILLALFASVASADVPQLINYQGKLTDAGGRPVTAVKSMKFAFYDAEVGGELLPAGMGTGKFMEKQDVAVTDGIFNVLIGSATVGGVPKAVFNSADVFLSVTVEGEEQTPRQRVGSVPFAFKSANAEAMEARVAAIEDLLSNVYRDGNTLVFNGLNVQIVNGADATDSEANGLGNLIVGYNEERGDGSDDRSGSHNIVVGKQNNFSSWGGLVAGRSNTVSAPYACVSGGSENTASGESSSVSGGRYNTASGDGASVAGGGGPDVDDGNTAFGHYSAVLGGTRNIAGDVLMESHDIGSQATVSGGTDNAARGVAASVSGGCQNTAGGTCSSVGGGYQNRPNGMYSSVSGGGVNTASGMCSAVSGGRNNAASGEYSSVVGGGGELSSMGNRAFGNYSAILGGQENLAGDLKLADHSVGERSTISGGRLNRTTGLFASVGGGISNTAGYGSSVSGGYHNSASATCSSVSGGQYNTASADYASVSGGNSNAASGKYASVSGGRDNEAAGEGCSVSGGSGNQAGKWFSANDCASVSGGWSNQASGDHAAVSGGSGNTAAGSMSSVSGGRQKGVTASYQWRAGDLWTDPLLHFPICTELDIVGAGGAP